MRLWLPLMCCLACAPKAAPLATPISVRSASAAVPSADAITTRSGLIYEVLRPGDGDLHPGPNDSVTVHYEGSDAAGEVFDSSYERGEPATFPVNRVVDGFAEGVRLMTVGAKYRLFVPEHLGYKGVPGRPQGLMVYVVELEGILRVPPPPPDLNEPGEGSFVTDSGLTYRTLVSGGGAERPTSTSRVEVHYTIWNQQGEVIDSSVVRGRPALFPVSGVIAGWQEALQLMVVGDQVRIWVPEDLAYKGAPGKPPGTLIADIELLDIEL